MVTKLLFLGFIVNAEGIQVDEEKVKAIKERVACIKNSNSINEFFVISKFL